MQGHIYMLYCPIETRYGGIYIGKTNKPFNHPQTHWRFYLKGKGNKSQRIVQAIAEHGAENFRVYCLESCVPDHLLNEREMFYIRQFGSYGRGYNLTQGGDGWDSKTARQWNLQRVKEGTHLFLDPEFRKRLRLHHLQRVASGTHNFLGENNPVYQQLADGTHNFLGSETATQRNIKRVLDGTHHFLTPEFKGRVTKWNLQRVEDGTHNFLGESNPSHQRVKNGTHNFAGMSNPSHQRVENGTHNFLAKNRDPEVEKRRIASIRKTKARKRHKTYWCYIIALSRFWYETHDHTLKRPAEIFDKEVPNTSDAQQLTFF